MGYPIGEASMVRFVVLNELSLPAGNNYSETKEKLIVFIKLLSELKTKYIETIRTIEDIKNLEIMKNTKFYEFIGIIDDKDLKSKIISLISNRLINISNPLIADSEIQENDYEIVEYKYKDKKAEGFGVADIFDTFTISFNNCVWENPFIEVEKSTIIENGEILRTTPSIKNVCKSEMIEIFNDYFEKMILNSTKIEQKDFWKEKENYFNKIRFCDEIEEQVRVLETEVYELFLHKLLLIESGLKNITDWNYSGESDSVKADKELKKMREFYHADIGKIYFDNHIKSFPNGKRMYFLENNNIIYIGYIGKHLKTKKN